MNYNKTLKTNAEDIVFEVKRIKITSHITAFNTVQAMTDDGFPYATVSIEPRPTTGIIEQPLAEDEFILKHYGENGQITDEMYKEGLIEKTGRYYSTDFAMCAIVRMTDKFKDYIIQD